MAGWIAALGVVVLAALLWQSFHSAREANRQKIIAALDNAVAEIREQILVVEMTAQTTERVVRAICPENPECLRPALETAAAAFVQQPELSHLGLILSVTGAHGNLERAANGDVLMWLYSGDGKTQAVTQSLRLTDAGFAPHAIWPNRNEDLYAHPVYRAALQGARQSAWQLRTHPWMMHDGQRDSPWGIGYTKALYSDAGRLLGVLDASFDMSAIRPYLDALQLKYGVRLDVIEQGNEPRWIGSDARAPQPIPAAFAPLLAVAPDAFAETMTIDDERHWVAARPLTLSGGVSWLVVASKPAPLFNVLSREQIWEVLAMTGGAALVAMRLVRRFGKARAPGGASDADQGRLITHDDLTGLPNRVLIQQRITHAIARARENGRLVALLYVNFDRFKAINDSYGYLFGNIALTAAGAALVRMVRPQDTVAYLSGDRFLILMPDVRDRDEATRLADQIVENLHHPIIVQTREIHLTASIGVALFPQDGDTPDALINSADMAMYAAKKLGRNTVQFFTAAMGQEAHEHSALEKRLRDTVETEKLTEQLYLVYQPKVSLANGSIVGCEALLRWKHPEAGMISPDRFIPIAEESGLIIPIGDWVLETACRQAKAWLDAGLSPVRVAVNLSVGQFLRRDVVAWVTETLQRTGLPAQCLQLELTESLPPKNLDETIDTFQQLQSLGVILALDDFGTGYSNLSHLKRFPIHTLKIDQSFVRNALTSSQDAAIVRAVITLAHRLNFKALAEGVETEAQLRFLRAEHCDEIQGYYFSAPLAPEIYAAKLRDRVGLRHVQVG